jgi:hypothetical protein
MPHIQEQLEAPQLSARETGRIMYKLLAIGSEMFREIPKDADGMEESGGSSKNRQVNLFNAVDHQYSCKKVEEVRCSGDRSLSVDSSSVA